MSVMDDAEGGQQGQSGGSGFAAVRAHSDSTVMPSLPSSGEGDGRQMTPWLHATYHGNSGGHSLKLIIVPPAKDVCFEAARVAA